MTLTRFISLVKFEHTIFALPFAYVGAFLAVDGVPSAHDLIWIASLWAITFPGATWALARSFRRMADGVPRGLGDTGITPRELIA